MAAIRFDLRAMWQAVDEERRRRSMTWVDLAADIGVSTSTIRRCAQADDAEADGVLALLRWLNAIPEVFVAGSEVVGQQLSCPENTFIRVDMELVASAEGDSAGSRGRTRTTIQRVVVAAQRSGQPVPRSPDAQPCETATTELAASGRDRQQPRRWRHS